MNYQMIRFIAVGSLLAVLGGSATAWPWKKDDKLQGKHKPGKLPTKYQRMSFKGKTFYRKGPTFYEKRGKQYHPILPPIGAPVRPPPYDARRIPFKGKDYFYHSGIFYTHGPKQYVIASPLVGLRVPTLPYGSHVVYLGGAPHYMCNGIYYRHESSGFVVVQPQVAPRTSIPVQATVTVPAATGTVTVWIDNPNGSRTPVTLRAAVGGTWIGPRGEFYAVMPTDQQLRPIYGLQMRIPAAPGTGR